MRCRCRYFFFFSFFSLFTTIIVCRTCMWLECQNANEWNVRSLGSFHSVQAIQAKQFAAVDCFRAALVLVDWMCKLANEGTLDWYSWAAHYSFLAPKYFYDPRNWLLHDKQYWFIMNVCKRCVRNSSASCVKTEAAMRSNSHQRVYDQPNMQNRMHGIVQRWQWLNSAYHRTNTTQTTHTSHTRVQSNHWSHTFNWMTFCAHILFII